MRVKILGMSKRIQEMTGRGDVTDCCVSNLALNWLGKSLMYQEKYDDAIKIYEDIFEINQTFGSKMKLRRQQVGRKQLS